ncbi:MAG: sel1 repeat family protein [Chlorobium sp.]|jgi:hypothetical protein|nr:sel1 repeat family protein [Chlorobium sp.]
MKKRAVIIGAGLLLLVVVLELFAIAFNLEPSKGVKRIGWAIEFQWNRLVALTGNAEAQYALGRAYGKGEGVDADTTEAVKWVRRSADQGSARGQANLGELYNSGIGVKKSYAEAVKWSSLAASKGDPRAHYALGFYYEYGQGVKLDIKKAKEYYGKACDLGEQEGCRAYNRLDDAGY